MSFDAACLIVDRTANPILGISYSIFGTLSPCYVRPDGNVISCEPAKMQTPIRIRLHRLPRQCLLDAHPLSSKSAPLFEVRSHLAS